MRQISAKILDDASLAELEAGHRLILLRGDKPLAEVVPIPLQNRDDAEAERRRAGALLRLKTIMAKGYDLGVRWNGRDELYDRD